MPIFKKKKKSGLTSILLLRWTLKAKDKLVKPQYVYISIK